MRRRAVAVLGGAFAPFHRAHLQLAKRALRELPVASAAVIPNGCPPHRPPPTIPWEKRVNQCRTACRGVARLRIGLDEPPDKTQTTVATLLRRKKRRQRLILLLGADAFADFAKWRSWRRILKIANIAVARRGDNPRPSAMVRARCRVARRPQNLANGVGRVLMWKFRPENISSTQIRRRGGK